MRPAGFDVDAYNHILIHSAPPCKLSNASRLFKKGFVLLISYGKMRGSLRLQRGPRSRLPAFLVYRPESAPKPTLSDKHEAVGWAKNPEQHPKRKRAPKKPIRRRAPDRTNSEKRRRNDDRDGSIAGAPRRRRCRPPARHRRRSARRRSSRKRTRSRPRREHPTIRFACSRTGTAPDVDDHWAHGDPLTDETG